MQAPKLSIVLVADATSRLDEVLQRLREQGDPERLEVVIAALPGTDAAACARMARGFGAVRVVAADGTSLAIAEGIAARAATAPWVCFALAHVLPETGFVEALLGSPPDAARWAAIGPALAVANPRSAVARAGWLIHYGAWSTAAPRGRAASVPGHASIYARDALLALGAELEQTLDAGPALQAALARRGGAFWFEPAARAEVVMVSTLGWFLVDQLCAGAKFATSRRRGWTPGRRALYAAGAPLIPAVRLGRIVARLRRQGRARELLPVLPALLAGLSCSAAGELVGYVFGEPTRSISRELSLHRHEHVARPAQSGDQ